MVSRSVWKSLISFATILSCVLAKSAIRKRDVGNSLDTVLETQINSFPLESYMADVQFVQKVDKVNKISHYKLLTDEIAAYERNHDDSTKDVIILTKDEDKIPFKKTKRAYVVLKKAQSSIYFAKLALIRDATPQDKNAVSINGENRVVEWTIYDDHLIAGSSPLTLVALTCLSSILVPCLFNESALTPPEDFLPTARFAPKHSPKSLTNEVESIKLQTADGSDPDDNYDYFIDLEVNKVQGRLLMGVLSGVAYIVPGVLGTVTNLLCTVLNVLSICPMGLIGRRKKRSADLDRVMEYPGWKTQYLSPSKDITFQHENEIFFGFGNCPYTPAKPTDLINSNIPDAVLNYYVTVLRANCIQSTIDIIQSLLKDDLITSSTNKLAFELTPNHRYLTTSGLSMKELLNLNTATELVAFSTYYIKQAQTPQDLNKKITSPDGQRQISRSIHFIVQVGLTYLKLTREQVRSHILHLTRNLAMNVISVFSKLAQDNQNLQNCGDCKKDKEINLNDRVYVMALSKFIKSGLGPVERGADVFATFDTFYKQNEATILKVVNIYS